jgi:mono/diheme cytochrome c family protein
MKTRLAPFAAGVIAGVIALLVVVYVYFAGGFAPAATTAPDMPFEKMLAQKALRVRIEREAPTTPAPAATEARLLDGVDVYRAQCAVCHGLPEQAKTAIAAGMYPRPPQLFQHGVDDDPIAQTWWKVQNGIRLTGMPGYASTLSAEQVWNVSLLLATDAKALSPTVQAALRSPAH